MASCFHGGLTTSMMDSQGAVTALSFLRPVSWRLLLVLPQQGLATSKARALLPDTCSRDDAILNIQATALLVAAFAQNRPDLLQRATIDRLHQPFRSSVCPLLPLLLPLAGSGGVFSVTLSGAGPSVLLITDEGKPLERIRDAIARAISPLTAEILETRVASVLEK